MRSIVVHDSPGLPLSEYDLASVESQLGILLPEDYAAFLRKHNGGRPQPNVFRVSSQPVSNRVPNAATLQYFERLLAFLLGANLDGQDEDNDLVQFREARQGSRPTGPAANRA